MELRQYWNVIWKRRWLVLAIVVVAALVSALMYLASDRTYKAEVRFATRQDTTGQGLGRPLDLQGQMLFMFDPYYYRWFGSEFLVDDYTQIAASDAFAQSVLATMREAGFAGQVLEDLTRQEVEAGRTATGRGDDQVRELEDQIARLSPAHIRGAIEADRRHRELRLTVTTPGMELTKAVADAAGIVLTDARIQPVRGDMVDDLARFSQIDRVGLANIESSRSQDILNAIIRVIIGLVAALALAFLLEYLDNSVRDERDAAKVLDLPVLGAIPRG
ncbi:MAG TPA: Wzz/FepE/Etk N-terminal domain-containing protein [Chloroflexia bacterium]|nr:Wzz/FepE/Etk N-terminal domain-containing protein [Chloroflexia bacterium]